MGGGKKIQNMEIETQVHARVAEIEEREGRPATRREIMDIGRAFQSEHFKSSKGWASKFQNRRKLLLGIREKRATYLEHFLESKAKDLPFNPPERIPALAYKSWWYFKTTFQEK